MKPVMPKRFRFLKSKAGILSLIFAVTVALLPTFVSKAAAAAPVPCATWADLRAALQSPTTTDIVLTANITISNACQINTAMPDGLVIDGLDPVTNTIHTLTDGSTGTTGNLYINTTGTLKSITFQNLNIVGKASDGFYINDSVRGFDCFYDNVTFTGPQMNFNRYGSVWYKDCDITITANEGAQAALVTLEGTTTIYSSTTSWVPLFNTEYRYDNNPSINGKVEVKPGAVINVLTSSDLYGLGDFGSNLSVDFIMGSGASFDYIGNKFTPDGSSQAFVNFILCDGTASQRTRMSITLPTTSPTSNQNTATDPLLYLSGNLVIGDYCDLTTQAHLGGSYDGFMVYGYITVGNNSTLGVTAVTPNNNTGNMPNNLIFIDDDTGIGLTVGSNSTVAASVKGNKTNVFKAVVYINRRGGIHLNGPNSSLAVDVTGTCVSYGIYAPNSDIKVGPSCTLTGTVGGTASNNPLLSYGGRFEAGQNAQIEFTPQAANTTWTVHGTGQAAGAFILGEGASFTVNAPGAGTSNTSGLYVQAHSGIQMADSSSLKVYASGHNDTGSTQGNIIYAPNGDIVMGEDCTLDVTFQGASSNALAAISAKGITEGANSTVNVDMNATTSRYGIYINGNNMVVGQNAVLRVRTASNVTSRNYLLYLASASSLTVGQGATFHLLAQDTVNSSSSATIYVNASNGSTGLTFNSPKSVVLYNGVGKSLVRYNSAGAFAINNVQQINEWNATIAWMPAISAGRFSPLPNYSWRATATPNTGLVGTATVTGQITGGASNFTSLTAPGVANVPELALTQNTNAPTTTTFNLSYAGNAYMVSFGYLPLSATYDCVVNPLQVSGTTEPGANVILAKWNGTQYVQVGSTATADSNGAYDINLQSITNISPNVNYAVITSDPTRALNSTTVTRFYLVTFDANGGVNDPALPYPYYVIEGATIPVPPSPVKGLETFGGWYQNTSLTQAFNFNTTPINADLILYAKWSSSRVTINEKILGPSGQPATSDDYHLAGLDPSKNQAFELIITSVDTGEVYHVIACRDQPTIIESLPAGETLIIRAVSVQHYMPDSIVLVSESTAGSFTAGTAATCTIVLDGSGQIELDFFSKIAPAGFGNSQDASNLFKVATAE